MTSNAVDFFPYRSGPQSDPTNGEYPVLTAPIPVSDAAPSVSLAAPASAARGATVALTATAADDFGIKRVRFAEGLTTLGTATTPPYTVSFTIPADAACNSVRTFSAVAMDSAGQTTSATTPVTVACAPGAQPNAAPDVADDVTPEPGSKAPSATTAGAPAGTFVSWPRSIAGKSRIVFNASAPAGLKSAAVILGSRTLCVLSAAPFACEFSPHGRRCRRPVAAPRRHRPARPDVRGQPQRRRLALRRQAQAERVEEGHEGRRQAHA